jgi:hypothetical protein
MSKWRQGSGRPKILLDIFMMLRGTMARPSPGFSQNPSSIAQCETAIHPHFFKTVHSAELSLPLCAGRALYRRPAVGIPNNRPNPKHKIVHGPD